MSGSGDARIMVIGIGNPDCADDGVGLSVASRLTGRLPSGITLVTRSGDILGLVPDWAGCHRLVCVDAAAPMGQPGRVHRFDATDRNLPAGASLTSSHAFGLAEAIAIARELHLLPAAVTVYAIEGSRFDTGEQMTPEVAAAVDQVAELVIEEVSAWRMVEIEASARCPQREPSETPFPTLQQACLLQPRRTC